MGLQEQGHTDVYFSCTWTFFLLRIMRVRSEVLCIQCTELTLSQSSPVADVVSKSFLYSRKQWALFILRKWLLFRLIEELFGKHWLCMLSGVEVWGGLMAATIRKCLGEKTSKLKHKLKDHSQTDLLKMNQFPALKSSKVKRRKWQNRLMIHHAWVPFVCLWVLDPWC